VCDLSCYARAPSGLYCKARASSFPATCFFLVVFVCSTCFSSHAFAQDYIAKRGLLRFPPHVVSCRVLCCSCCVFVCVTCFVTPVLPQDYIAKRGLLRFPPHVSFLLCVCVCDLFLFLRLCSGLYRKARASSFPAKRFLLCVCVCDLFLILHLCSLRTISQSAGFFVSRHTSCRVSCCSCCVFVCVSSG